MEKMVMLSVILLLEFSISCSYGLKQHTVGDSIWSIPPTNNFYTNWSSSYSFEIGDTLYFDFNSEFYNVVLVSRGEYDSCSSDQPFNSFMDGPLVFPLNYKGVFYFICNVSNYCELGQKVSVIVGPKSMQSSPIPSSQVPGSQPQPGQALPPTRTK